MNDSQATTLTYRSYGSLQDLPGNYADLFATQTSTSLYRTRPWFENLIATCFEPGDQCCIAGVESDDGTVVLALVLRTPAGQNGSAYSGWKLGAGTLASLTNYQSSYYAPLSADLSRDKLAAACDCLVRGLAADPAGYYFVDLNLLDPDAPHFAELARAFEQIGFRAKPYLYKGNWYEYFEFDKFTDYVATRNKSARKAIQNYQRKHRKLIKEDRIGIRILTGGTDAELADILSAYDAIYGSSWKETDAYPEFATGLIRSCAEQGSLRFGLVSVDGTEAALEFAVVTGKEAVMMRTAYAPQFHKLSVGSIAMLAVIEHLIDVDHVTSIDFGTDDDPYKATWVSRRRERWGQSFIRSGSLKGRWALARIAAREWDRRGRDVLKKLLRRKPAAEQ